MPAASASSVMFLSAVLGLLLLPEASTSLLSSEVAATSAIQPGCPSAGGCSSLHITADRLLHSSNTTAHGRTAAITRSTSLADWRLTWAVPTMKTSSGSR